MALGHRFLALRTSLSDVLAHRLTTAWQGDITQFLAEGTARTRRALLPMALAGFELAMRSDTPASAIPVAPVVPVAPSTHPTLASPVPVTCALGVCSTFLVNLRATTGVPPFPPANTSTIARAHSSDSAALASNPSAQEGAICHSCTGTPKEEPAAPRFLVEKGKKRVRSETLGRCC